MILVPNDEGWSFSDQMTDGTEALVYNNDLIVYRGNRDVSTTSTLFTGTLNEIDSHIIDLNLKYISETEIIPEGSEADLEIIPEEEM